MISDSIPWKDDLLVVAKTLRGRTSQRRWTERSFYLTERDIMIGAFAVRRLLEAYKVSDTLASRQVHVHAHAPVGPPPTHRSRFFFWEHYDMESSTRKTLNLTQLCNQIIHSWLWSGSFTDATPSMFDGIYVASDQQRNRSLYFVPIDVLCDVFEAVGSEVIVSTSFDNDPMSKRPIRVEGMDKATFERQSDVL